MILKSNIMKKYLIYILCGLFISANTLTYANTEEKNQKSNNKTIVNQNKNISWKVEQNWLNKKQIEILTQYIKTIPDKSKLKFYDDFLVLIDSTLKKQNNKKTQDLLEGLNVFFKQQKISFQENLNYSNIYIDKNQIIILF